MIACGHRHKAIGNRCVYFGTRLDYLRNFAATECFARGLEFLTDRHKLMQIDNIQFGCALFETIKEKYSESDSLHFIGTVKVNK